MDNGPESLTSRYRNDIDNTALEIQEDATYVERPLMIVNTKEQVLRTKTIH